MLACSRDHALSVLAAQPGLAFEGGRDALIQRLEGLSVTFGLGMDEARALAVEQPVRAGADPSACPRALSMPLAAAWVLNCWAGGAYVGCTVPHSTEGPGPVGAQHE